MSIAVVTQAYDEARRLAIAGSSLGPGDFRLKKLIAPLEQAGAKAPVFAKVAQAIQAVVESNDKSAAAALLELTTLVSAVLYTQGATGSSGELTTIPSTALALVATKTTARTMKPLLEALSSTGSGRLEVIKEAVERKLFLDLRLIKPALHAIDDPYSEIADLIVEQVLPHYGIAIYSELAANFDCKSKSVGHGRRLRLLQQLNPIATRHLVEQTLAEGSKELKVVAIGCLGESEQDFSYLIEQSKARAKEVRGAALCALLRRSRQNSDTLQPLLKAITTEDIELIASVISAQRIAELDAAVIEQLQKQVDALFESKDAKKLAAGIIQVQHLLRALHTRNDQACEQLLLDLFARAPKLAKLKGDPSGADLNEAIAYAMSRVSGGVKKHLAEHAMQLRGESFRAALQAASDVYSPEDFYQCFNPVLESFKHKKGGTDIERAEMLESLLSGQRWDSPHHLLQERTPGERNIDSRWLDLAVDIGRTELVCALLRPNHTKAAAHLASFFGTKGAGGKDIWLRFRVLDALAKIHYENLAALVVQVIENDVKVDAWYARYGLRKVLPLLPTALLESLIPKYPKLADAFIDAINESKPKSE